MALKKVKLGIFNLSSCEGCTVQILNLGDKLFDLLELFDLVESRVLGIKKNYDKLDIALVEGCVMSDEEEEKLKKIREKSKLLIALGDCAVSANRNLMKDVNGSESVIVRPLQEIVKVDYFIPGCPINSDEFYMIMIDLYMGKKIQRKSITVCSECILNENECLLNKGIPCLGPITHGGCNALCPSHNRPCFGCRGLSDDANIEELIELFREKGIEVSDYLIKLFREMRNAGKND